MNDINVVTICGRLTKKPEIKYLTTGTIICNFDIASNYGYKDKQKVNFLKVSAFGKIGESIIKYLDTGSQVVVAGRLDYQTWQDKEGNKKSIIKIVANSVQFVGGKKKEHKEEINIENQINPSINQDLPNEGMIIDENEECPY